MIMTNIAVNRSLQRGTCGRTYKCICRWYKHKIIKTRKLYTACISPKSNTSRTNSFTYHLLVVFLINCNLTILFWTMIDDDQCSLFEDAHQCHLQDSYSSCNDTLSEPRYLQAPTRCTQVTRQPPSSATAGFHSETGGTEQECVRSF